MCSGCQKRRLGSVGSDSSCDEPDKALQKDGMDRVFMGQYVTPFEVGHA